MDEGTPLDYVKGLKSYWEMSRVPACFHFSHTDATPNSLKNNIDCLNKWT